MPRWSWTAISIGAAALALLLAPSAHASWMVPPSPYRPKDFALVKKDGVYHLFYIRHNFTLPTAQTENDFGHAISLDLYNWFQEPPVLPVRPDGWDNLHVWAPSIVLHDSTYTMFYCGVTDQPGVYSAYQRIGVATSTDLYNWTRPDQPVFSCDQVQWTVCDSLNSTLTGFRDPFVMPDPDQPGGWLMAYTANPASDSTDMVVALAASGGDLTSWQDVQPLWVTSEPTTNSIFAESPHLFEHEGTWFLFFTVDGSNPIAFATTSDPRSDPSGWTWRGPLNAMLGTTASTWFASEYLRDGTQEYFAYVNAGHIEINLMRWTAPDQFAFDVVPLFHVVSLSFPSTSVIEGQAAALQMWTVNGAGQSVSLAAEVLNSSGQWSAVPPDSLGIPSSLPVTADTTVWTWTARRWPAGSAGPTQIHVMTTDLTAVSSVLTINATPVPPSSSSDGSSDPLRLHIARFANGPGRLRIGAELASDAAVRLEIYDIQGRRVATLANGRLPRGMHTFEWDIRGAAGARAGVYLVRLSTPGLTRVARVAMLP